GDALVRNTMTLSNLAMAADQVRAGTSGLLGVGSLAGVTGQGIGIAILDSGIAKHDALAKKVVASVSFVTGDSNVKDAYGHGTHVAGIIAGLAGVATPVTTLFSSGIAP